MISISFIQLSGRAAVASARSVRAMKYISVPIRMPALFRIATFGMVLATCAPSAHAGELSVEIAHSKSRPGKELDLERPELNKIDVVVRNGTERPLHIWKAWNMWGYSLLKFSIVTDSGDRLIVQQRIREWDVNFPDYYVLHAGRSAVYSIDFEDGTWSHSIRGVRVYGSEVGLRQSDVKQGSIRAVFSQREDVREAPSVQVWEGTVYSKEERILYDEIKWEGSRVD